MKNKQKSLEIAMEYQIQRDRLVNQYVQLRQTHPDHGFEDLRRQVWRLQALFEGWASISGLLTRHGGKQ